MHTHSILIDMAQASEGENTYTCSDCGMAIILVWNGVTQDGVFTPTNYGLRPDDADNPAFGEVTVNYL